MRNYAEELAFWFLRLNGFFPITDFVLHRTRPEYSSDCDILAVRPPHVYEEFGGNWNDWDEHLRRLFDPNRTLGIICEVKAGDYDHADILKEENVKYSLKRLGFVPYHEIDSIAEELKTKKHVDVGHSYRVIQLLLSNRIPQEDRKFYYFSIKYIRNFIKQRMKNYPIKGSDWTFFQSSIIQEIIWEVKYLNRN